MTQWNWKRNAYCCAARIVQENETPEMFARSWYRGISPLYWRIPILMWAVIILIWSSVGFWGPPEKFLIYMTHCGLIFIIFESMFGIIATREPPKDKLADATFGLPWYVKVYWLLYNISIPLAFLVTVFYWGVLKTSAKRMYYAPNPILDVMIHSVNSVVMFIELMASAHPSHLMHIMQPLYVALAYTIFTVIYYFAGGVDPWGHEFIYPVVDWSKPNKTIVVITITGLVLAIMHLLVVGLSKVRDALARYLRDRSDVYNDQIDA